MKKIIIRKICAVLYHTIGVHLPASYTYHSLFGRTIHVSYGLYVRRILASQMLGFAGENINVEKGANFGRNVSLGANSGIGYNCEVASGTIIGDNVMMGPEVVIFNINHCHAATEPPNDPPYMVISISKTSNTGSFQTFFILSPPFRLIVFYKSVKD